MLMASHEGTFMIWIYLYLGKIVITVDWDLNKEIEWIKKKLGKNIRNNVVPYTQV